MIDNVFSQTFKNTYNMILQRCFDKKPMTAILTKFLISRVKNLLNERNLIVPHKELNSGYSKNENDKNSHFVRNLQWAFVCKLKSADEVDFFTVCAQNNQDEEMEIDFQDFPPVNENLVAPEQICENPSCQEKLSAALSTNAELRAQIEELQNQLNEERHGLKNNIQFMFSMMM